MRPLHRNYAIVICIEFLPSAKNLACCQQNLGLDIPHNGTDSSCATSKANFQPPQYTTLPVPRLFGTGSVDSLPKPAA